jgi:hypothetical protein
LDLTLRNNDFTFNGEFFLQICGAAMGKHYAPSLADLYMEQLDDAANQYQIIILLLYSRFLDDLFFLWTGTVEQLQLFQTYLNQLLEGITVTLQWSRTSVDFLDTTVYKSAPFLEDGREKVKLLTKVFFKPTDTHQLLHKDSFHPRHTCLGVLKSQMLRFKRLSSTYDDYNQACKVLTDALAKRNYSRRLMRKYKNDTWNAIERTSRKKEKSALTLPIVVPFNALGTALGRSWRHIIADNATFNTTRIVTAYTVGNNLHKSLVRSLLPTVTEKPGPQRPKDLTLKRPGCYRCTSNRCRVCHRVQQCLSFTSSVNGRSFGIKDSISCKTSNIVYLITCIQCSKQYVGETSRTLADRANDHFSAIRLKKPTPVGLHFNLPNHDSSHVSITGIEAFTDNNSRKIKEITWQNLLQTCHPHGINQLKSWHT